MVELPGALRVSTQTQLRLSFEEEPLRFAKNEIFASRRDYLKRLTFY
jgi:hypothetical protein